MESTAHRVGTLAVVTDLPDPNVGPSLGPSLAPNVAAASDPTSEQTSEQTSDPITEGTAEGTAEETAEGTADAEADPDPDPTVDMTINNIADLEQQIPETRFRLIIRADVPPSGLRRRFTDQILKLVSTLHVWVPILQKGKPKITSATVSALAKHANHLEVSNIDMRAHIARLNPELSTLGLFNCGQMSVPDLFWMYPRMTSLSVPDQLSLTDEALAEAYVSSNTSLISKLNVRGCRLLTG